MSHSHELQSEDFEALLALLSPDRNEAGEAYEKLRAGLMRFFSFRGCPEPESLADETLTRVAARATSFDPSKNVKVITFVYGFASKVYLECFRSSNPRAVPIDLDLAGAGTAPPSDDGDPRIECLEKCLKKVPTLDSELLLEYYSREKHEKIVLRREMAERLGIRPDTLHTRIHRIRNQVGACVRKCAER
jgi:DNA-directed RNA polymerase specialized sigma24 family protein